MVSIIEKGHAAKLAEGLIQMGYRDGQILAIMDLIHGDRS